MPRSLLSEMITGTTRRGADLGVGHCRDLRDAVIQAKVRQSLAVTAKWFVYGEQVHGDRVEVITTLSQSVLPGQFLEIPKTDALITNQPDVCLLVLTADCLPVSLSVPGWTGIVHAGWRGTRLGITAKALKQLLDLSGAAPDQVQVRFGPCIRTCHYEVGPEFDEIFPHSVVMRGDKRFFDLPGENVRQISALGIDAQRIHDDRHCTLEANTDFYSYRLEGAKAGRTISFTALSGRSVTS